ncbi:hypothetical protein ACN28S_08410 [Cystobacter fuscus]
MNRTLPPWALLLALVLVGVAAPVAAHPLRSTAVLLDPRESSVEGEVQLPLDQLELTLRRGLLEDTSTLVARRGEELTRYLGEHRRCWLRMAGRSAWTSARRRCAGSTAPSSSWCGSP